MSQDNGIISLADLREMKTQNKIPASLFVENISNMKASGERVGPILRVVISINGANGKERLLEVSPTIATTDLLDQATLDEILSSPQFAATVRKNLIRIVTKERARKIDSSDLAISNQKNRARMRGEQPEENKEVSSSKIKTLVSDWVKGSISESTVLEELEAPSLAFTKTDLVEALSLVSDPTSDVFQTITEKLSDFDVS